MDWAFLAIGGFLLGSVLYSGYYTTRFEPEVKGGYGIIGIGIFISVATNTYVDFFRDTSDWFRAMTLFGYLTVAVGLIILIRERRKHRREVNDGRQGT